MSKIIAVCSYDCVIQRKISVPQKIPPVINYVLKLIIKYNNGIIYNAKCECIFKVFCYDKNTNRKILFFSQQGKVIRSNKTLLDINSKMNDFLLFIKLC